MNKNHYIYNATNAQEIITLTMEFLNKKSLRFFTNLELNIIHIPGKHIYGQLAHIGKTDGVSLHCEKVKYRVI